MISSDSDGFSWRPEPLGGRMSWFSWVAQMGGERGGAERGWGCGRIRRQVCPVGKILQAVMKSLDLTKQINKHGVAICFT